MNPKTKMKIHTAVSDYQRMFAEDNKLFIEHMAQKRQGLREDFATLEGAGDLGRHLMEVPEKLANMIGMKLTEEERQDFREKESVRWFVNEYPQFRVASHV